jgi:hypothetical protein
MNPNAAERAVVDPDEPEGRQLVRADLRLFVRNSIAIAAVGVGCSWWILYYTDWFPLVGGLLGLGGLFAWIAFLANLVSDDRKEELQNALDQGVLSRPNTTTYAVSIAVLLLAAAGFWGTIVIRAPGEDRVVEVRDGDRVIDTIEVPASTEVKRLLFVRGTRDVVLSTPGLPELGVTVHNLLRTTVVAPKSFTAQPVLLARVPPDLGASKSNSKVRIRIKRARATVWTDYGEIPLGQYDGESIWIGSPGDVRVPPDVKEEWDAGVAGVTAEIKALYMTRWMRTKGVGAGKPLRVNDHIRVCVMTDDGKGEKAFAEAIVLSRAEQKFPQQLLLTASVNPRCGL